MNSDKKLQDDYQNYLENLWKDRVNLPKQAQTGSDFGAKISLLRHALTEGESEQAALRATLQECESERARLQAIEQDSESEMARLQAIEQYSESEMARLREEANHARTRMSMLESALIENLRKPWLPVKEALNRRLAHLAAGIVKPFSEHRAMRFKHSASKRNPRRYLSTDRADQKQMIGGDVSGNIHTHQTQNILKRYLPSELQQPLSQLTLHMQLGSSALVRNRLKSAPKSAALPQNGPPAFSIVTPFFAHLGFFADCAKSIATLAIQTAQPFEWVIVNDDPSVLDETLLRRIPDKIRAQTRVLSDGNNHGISQALDWGISAAKNPWIVLLDCDDMLEPNALDALNAAIKKAPKCRYFSSLMIDIDDAGQELRRRKADHDLVDLFQAGMIGGHMVTFRHDLYKELGGFDLRFSGVQDYDFVLRVAAREQIQRISQHLYRYRWHSNTQSVSRIDRQEQLANAVRTAFLTETMGLQPDRKVRAPLPERPEIFCIMRTQGQRMELLTSAIESVRAQALPMTPCVVVHGDHETFDFVKQHLSIKLGTEHGERHTIILQASEMSRRRGYPCNVALDHLRAQPSRYDLLCFLDDDDHFLPEFSERLTRLIKMTGTDMAYGLANALPKDGEPYIQHKQRPAFSLLRANFMAFNSFLVRVDAVLDANIVFAEDMHYLEDHDFLVQLIAAGVQAAPLPEVVSEYRLIGDGNAKSKQQHQHFAICQRKVKLRAHQAAKTLSKDAFWVDILAFPAQSRSAFDESELSILLETRDMLKEQGDHDE